MKEYDISYYCLNIVDKIFDKYVFKNRNYDALCYYAVNNHMYLIDNKQNADSIIKKSRDIECKINSEMVEQPYEETNIYLKSDGHIKPIYENIKIENLMDEQYNNSIIFYDKDMSYNRSIQIDKEISNDTILEQEGI